MNSQENAQHIHDTIASNTQRLSGPILRRLLQSAVLPLVVFIITMLLSSYARQYVDMSFASSNLNLLTAISTSLLILVLTWKAWQWSERRFSGWASVQRMFGVVSSVARLEKALSNETSHVELDAAAQSAWDAYTSLAQFLNVTP